MPARSTGCLILKSLVRGVVRGAGDMAAGPGEKRKGCGRKEREREGEIETSVVGSPPRRLGDSLARWVPRVFTPELRFPSLPCTSLGVVYLKTTQLFSAPSIYNL